MGKRTPIVHRRSGTKAATSAAELSQLILKDTGIVFPPAAIIQLLRDNFTLISLIAHEIHTELTGT